MNGGHEFLNHQYFSIFFWRHIHIDTQSQRLAPGLYLILLFTIHWLIGRKDNMYSGDITLPFDQTTCSSLSVIVFQTMHLFNGIFQILFSVNLDINLINMYCKEMPISVSNGSLKKKQHSTCISYVLVGRPICWTTSPRLFHAYSSPSVRYWQGLYSLWNFPIPIKCIYY